MIKKIFFAIIDIISVLIIAAAIFVLCIVLMTTPGKPPQIMGYTVLRITTGSMAPTYGIDTMVIVKDTKASEIQEGDVISFYSTDPSLDGAVNTHRVVEVHEENGARTFVTKGDKNNVVDAYDVEEKYLIGKVVYASKLLGKLSRLVSNPIVFLPVILIPLAVILISNLVNTLVLAKKIAREEEETAVREAIKEIREKKKKDSV
nr:signal peptidase I [uncultured Dorea sp.]